MCGIAGAFSALNKDNFSSLEKAAFELKHRGPDFQKNINLGRVQFGHTRLSILDTSVAGNQPMQDPSGRYTLIYNGEIYNFKELAEKHLGNVGLISNSDTEVVLHLLIQKGRAALNDFNGFFAFAFYDSQNEELLLARDPIGIKPFYYYRNNSDFFFASELKAITQFPFERKLNASILGTYFHLNYIPAPYTILQDVYKLLPGECIEISKTNFLKTKYYQVEIGEERHDYGNAKNELKNLLTKSVEDRLLADVPIGSFLSGGLDSSIISAIAAKLRPDWQTFSIGYPEDDYYDESRFSDLVAKKIGSKHHSFQLFRKDLADSIPDFLEAIDEPFADSSSLAVFILSKHTRKNMTVALSGDGADELFAGYRKHQAEFLIRSNSVKNNLLGVLADFTGQVGKSRSSWLGDKARQLSKFNSGRKMATSERYWLWAGQLISEDNSALFSEDLILKTEQIKKNLLSSVNQNEFNSVLLQDVNLVLPNDMLYKVDLMSMAHGLEVRTPYLDKSLVSFAFSLPAKFKIDKKNQKKILMDTFHDILPREIYHRTKKGFEIPLESLLKIELKEEVERVVRDLNPLLKSFISSNFIVAKHKQLFSSKSEDSPAFFWALILLNRFVQRYLS